MNTQTTAGKRKDSSCPIGRERLNVTVLMGGPSGEREVSLLSGQAVAGALERVGHRVRRADISPGDTSALDHDDIDVVFIALHGQFGESGEVQQLCEERGLCYIGSGPRASELGLDKVASKQFFRQAGLRTPDWCVVEEFHTPLQYQPWIDRLSLPVVVKPIDSGSSIDITIARDAATRDAAISNVVDAYGRALVESFVAGRELTVGILGDQALPVLEVVPQREFYDYVAKYSDEGGTRYRFDHGLPERVVAAAQQASWTAHTVLGCRDISRVDFILNAEERLNILEINTIPGFTSHSLVPMAATKVGLNFDQLVDKLVAMATARAAASRPQ